MNARSRKRAACRAAVALCLCFTVSAAGAGHEKTHAGERTDRLALHDYMLNCMGCHQREGNGVEGKVPSLVGMDRYLDSPRGREYLIRVPGVAQSGLSDERLAILMNWALVEFGSEDFEPYTEGEVARWRSNPLRRTAGFFRIR